MGVAAAVARAPETRSPSPRETFRIPVMVAGTLLYGGLETAAVVRGFWHYEWIAIFLQVALLLPALLYGLRGQASAVPVPARAGLWTAVAIGIFLTGSAGLSALNVRGVSISDETAYRFEARILASGRLVAPPPPGTPEQPGAVPQALKFNHHVLWRNGWFGKYPLGWPLLLALPQKFGWEWLVNPLLAAGILIGTAAIARALGGQGVAFWAVALLVCSPCFLAPSVMLMSHALAGLLVVGACWAWIEGTRRREYRYFFMMYALLGLTFHVRPMTALLTSAILTGGAVLVFKREYPFLIRMLGMGIGLSAVTLGSVLLYNWVFTGNPWLSPYALARGLAVPVEISATFGQALDNAKEMWRFAAQSTLVFFFPLIFVLAAVGFVKNRASSPIVWLLPSLFLVFVLGHLVQTEGSASILGERYWFEGYFGIAILAALGIEAVAAELHTPRRAMLAAGCSLLVVQAMLTLAGARIILERSAPSAAVANLARQYRDCRCVVFLKESPPAFFGKHLNLNGPDWQQAQAFYAIDPGPSQRLAWARTLGRERWIVVGYDQQQGAARLEP